MRVRLTTDLWVSAYLARLRLADIPVYVMAKGDATAGAVVVKVATLDGNARAFQRGYDLQADRPVWMVLAEGPEPEVDQALARQRKRDADLWLIELEDRQARTLLGEEGLD